MFSTKDAKTDSGFQTPQFIKIGKNELKVVKLEAVKSKGGDKFKIVANFETKPLGGDFKGWEDAKGQIGKADFSIYTNGSDQYIQDAINKIATISEVAGVKAQIDAINSDSIDDYLAKVTKVLEGKYLWWLLGGEEFEGKDKEGKPRVKVSLKVPKFSYVAATEAELQAKLKDGVWPDMNTSWFYKRLATMDADKINKETGGNQPEPEQLPF